MLLRTQHPKGRKNLEPWKGGAKPDDLIVDVDKHFEKITEPLFQPVPSRTEPSTGIPTKNDVGIKMLDKAQRDTWLSAPLAKRQWKL